MQEEYRTLQREILELKTAQPIPSTVSLFKTTAQAPAGRYIGVHRWKITFKDTGDTNAPIIIAGMWDIIPLPYNSGADTQEIFTEFDNIIRYDHGFTIDIYSTREIQKVEMQTSPLPLEEWTQVRDFYPADMGSTPGWCLQNTRLGFHIYSGTYATARADMEAQQANGTLHSGTPPDYIACPIYFANYNITVAGHVAAWDHGRIYSDGVEFPSIDSVTNSYAGWGELCDGARVVQHV